MSKLKLYSIFHLNLMFSSIEKEERKIVIEKCYHPLLDLIEKYPIKTGVELSANTLSIIEKLDNSWIKRFKILLKNRKCELIGSGFVQSIGPLMPHLINHQNQKIGLEIYEKILNIKPEIALINEMAYSEGIVEHYIENNYKAIIMEWNNSVKFQKNWNNEFRYYPQLLESNGKKIKLIWADSIAFQKFQRVIHNELSLSSYMNYLENQISNVERYFPLYSGDCEIFDFRPGRYKTENNIKNHEWKKIEFLYNQILENKNFKFILPSNLLNQTDNEFGNRTLSLQTTQQPVIVKKQEKYNINRWALTGRNDFKINSDCYKIYNSLVEKKEVTREEWKELLLLWSSDFRTHITRKRWKKFYKKLTEKIINIEKPREKNNIFKEEPSFRGKNSFEICLKSKNIKIILNNKKGLSIKEIIFENISKIPLFGTLEHGYYDDISLATDFFSGHAIIHKPAHHKITDLFHVDPEIVKKNDDIFLKYNKHIEDVHFKYNFSLFSNCMEIYKEILIDRRVCSIIHPFSFTFFPESWDMETLYFETHNGGKNLEKFKLDKNIEFDQGKIISPLISTKDGMGATEGIFIIGDKYKKIIFEHNPAEGAMIPSIIFKNSMDNKIFFRLQYSIQEIDETFKSSTEEEIFNCRLNIKGMKK